MVDLILPGDPLFDITLATPPPAWKVQQQLTSDPLNFVVDAESGLLRVATPEELTEYLYGGEYDEVMGEEDEEEYWWWEYDMA